MASDQEPREYREDMLIEKFDLPMEWERQPQLYLHWAEEAVFAQTERDSISSQVDLLRAQLDSDIRLHPAEYGFVDGDQNAIKPTEPAIKACILQQPNFKEKSEELASATQTVNIMNAAKAGMDHKRRALTSLTELQIAGFYGSNTAPSENQIAGARSGQQSRSDAVETATGADTDAGAGDTDKAGDTGKDGGQGRKQKRSLTT